MKSIPRTNRASSDRLSGTILARYGEPVIKLARLGAARPDNVVDVRKDVVPGEVLEVH